MTNFHIWIRTYMLRPVTHCRSGCIRRQGEGVRAVR